MENKKEKKAVALRYKDEYDDVPVVVAKGKGLLAEKILTVAEEYQVAVKENRELADYLMALDLYDEIPPELYNIVAEILAFIYKMDGRQ